MHLNNIHVLVTRPAHQAEPLCQRIEAMGGVAIRLPVLEIVPLIDREALFACQAQLDHINMLIFISVNAVEYGLPNLLNNEKTFSKQLSVVAIGKKTAEALQAWGIDALCAPAPYNTEALLSLPMMQHLTGQRIVIVRGEGGREVLAEQLYARGAQVDYLNVYRRERPLTSSLPTIRPDIMIVTSSEGLHNLLSLLANQSWVKQTPLIVMSERTRVEALSLGFQAPVLVATAANDEGLLTMLVYWQTKERFANR
ncbi:uroporphyrinogen-III synthase [Beggiatoa leptomitoformis]|uniref:Uroporphyrinogen-III synthase n=1 Tax=Beggiatoa leptomitoformis TaxID=288004 RepID=A0A2N9YAD9_9GAMM|nr:uroporphyrinogen-III synthase [Beggiatoa leptomitoformis]AUI67433.1 uroporphyrinogen-III synthase [Beggiatoa leptomitoformis]QGX03556.1 uroporphyrinogen-III synthase [Beggiatoa leptomitoformis]